MGTVRDGQSDGDDLLLEVRYALVPLFGPDFPDTCISPASDRFGAMLIDPGLIVSCIPSAVAQRSTRSQGPNTINRSAWEASGTVNNGFPKTCRRYGYRDWTIVETLDFMSSCRGPSRNQGAEGQQRLKSWTSGVGKEFSLDHAPGVGGFAEVYDADTEDSNSGQHMHLRMEGTEPSCLTEEEAALLLMENESRTIRPELKVVRGTNMFRLRCPSHATVVHGLPTLFDLEPSLGFSLHTNQIPSSRS